MSLLKELLAILWGRFMCDFLEDIHVPSDITDVKPGVRIWKCHRCRRKYVMSDEHQAFLRYDNDPKFAEDFVRIYGERTRKLL